MKLISLQTSILFGVAFMTLTAWAKVGTLSGPFTHSNLQIFLIHGDTQLEERRYATLSEALEKKLVVVKETGNVQELTVENLSKEVTVFLNAGDIVKGGFWMPPLPSRSPNTEQTIYSGRRSPRQ